MTFKFFFRALRHDEDSFGLLDPPKYAYNIDIKTIQ